MISSRATTSAGTSDVVVRGVLVRRRGLRELLVEEAPECSRPLPDVGPALPEQLERRLVETSCRVLRGRGIGDCFELGERLQQPLGDVLCHDAGTPLLEGEKS